MGDGFESQFYTNLHFDFELNLYGWWVLKKSAFQYSHKVQTKNSSVHVLALPFVEFPSMIQKHRLAF